MKRMFVFGMALLALACLFPAGALGEEDSREAGIEKAKAFVETLKGYDEGLEGTFWYGVYFNEQKSLGKVKLTVGRAPEGSGAAYHFTKTMNMSFEEAKKTKKGEALYDETLALISDSSDEDNEKKRETESIKKDVDHWVCVKTVKVGEDERKGTYRLKVDGELRAEGNASWIFARRLPLDLPCSYIFKGVDWPEPSKPGEEERDLDSSAYRDVLFTVASAAPYKHRGKEVQAHMILVQEEGEADSYFYVDADHKILAWGREGKLVVFVAGTEEECGKDIEVPAGSADQEGAKDVVMIVQKVLCKALDPDVLDAVMDWEAVRQDLAKLDPTFEGITADEAASQDTVERRPGSLPRGAAAPHPDRPRGRGRGGQGHCEDQGARWKTLRAQEGRREVEGRRVRHVGAATRNPHEVPEGGLEIIDFRLESVAPPRCESAHLVGGVSRRRYSNLREILPTCPGSLWEPPQ
jgi:hypothetical protein